MIARFYFLVNIIMIIIIYFICIKGDSIFVKS
jgi:hypothetical protein